MGSLYKWPKIEFWFCVGGNFTPELSEAIIHLELVWDPPCNLEDGPPVRIRG